MTPIGAVCKDERIPRDDKLVAKASPHFEARIRQAGQRA